MIPRPTEGRVYSTAARAGLADCAPSGRMRLDALARLLQDVAYEDVENAGLADAAMWVVRRTRIHVARFPRFPEHLTLHTFCSGVGRAWAERRTTVESEGPEGPVTDVEAVSLWVHLDPVTWHPIPLSKEEIEIYGAGPGESRHVSHRLHHPPPPEDADSARPWRFRATECDIADHINNAAYWTPLDDELLSQGGGEYETADVEIEFRTPAQPGVKRIVTHGDRRWILGDDGEVHASLLVAFS